MGTDLKDLVELSKEGDQQAIAQLYDRTSKRAYYLAKQLVKDEDQAQDIVQDAYVKVFTNLHLLEQVENFQGWLNTIVVNKSKDYLKKKKPMLFSQMVSEEDEGSELDFEDEGGYFSPDKRVDYTETKRLIQGMIDRLPQEQRMAIVLFYLEEMPVKQIARVMECSEGTVKSRLNYGRKAIKAQVLELEKKGTKLYCVPFIPFLYWLLRQQAFSTVVPAAVGRRAVAAGMAAAGKAGAGAASGAGGYGAASGGAGAASGGAASGGGMASGAASGGAASGAGGYGAAEAGKAAIGALGQAGAGKAAAVAAGKAGAAVAGKASVAAAAAAGKAGTAAAGKAISVKAAAIVAAACIGAGGVGAGAGVYIYHRQEEAREAEIERERDEEPTELAAQETPAVEETQESEAVQMENEAILQMMERYPSESYSAYLNAEEAVDMGDYYEIKAMICVPVTFDADPLEGAAEGDVVEFSVSDLTGEIREMEVSVHEYSPNMWEYTMGRISEDELIWERELLLNGTYYSHYSDPAYGGDGKWHLVGDSDMEPLKEIFNGKIRLRKDADIQWINSDGTGHESISADELVEQTELLGEHDMSDSLDILWEEMQTDYEFSEDSGTFREIGESLHTFSRVGHPGYLSYELRLNEEGEITGMTELLFLAG